MSPRTFAPVLPKLLERTITSFESNSPADYAKHGSLLFGDMGTALLAMRLAPTPALADLVHTRAEANIALPIREAHVGHARVHGGGNPHGRDDTRNAYGAASSNCKRRGCLPIWRTRRKVHFGPRISTVPKIAFSGPFTASPATSFRCWAAGSQLTPAQQATWWRFAEDPRSECMAVRSWNNVGPEKQTREAAFHMSALSRCARHGDDICGCALRWA